MSDHPVVGPEAREGWTLEGPFLKDKAHYLSCDGTNPEAPEPGYGWPLGTECWYYVITGHGLRLCATGLTKETAARRVETIMDSPDPARESGAMSSWPS